MRVPVNKIENLDIHANYSKLVLRHSLEKIKMSYSIRCLHTDCGFAKRRHKHVRVCILIANIFRCSNAEVIFLKDMRILSVTCAYIRSIKAYTAYAYLSRNVVFSPYLVLYVCMCTISY